VTAAPASAQQIDAEADEILHYMADYVAGLKAFTVSYDAQNEVVDTDGQKLQYSASGSVAVERPGRLETTALPTQRASKATTVDSSRP
jgi:hypothetical protein